MTTELNKVEGFDPASYARTVTDANGQQSLYLDVDSNLDKTSTKMSKDIAF